MAVWARALLAFKSFIEAAHHGSAQAAAFGRLQPQNLDHIGPPILIALAVTAHADSMSRANDRRKRDKIADIGLIAGRQVLPFNPLLGMAACKWHRPKGDKTKGEDKDMHKLLVHEGTFARLAAELKARADKVDVVVLGNNGKFWDADGVAVDDVSSVTIAYGTPDVWFSSIAQVFVQTVIGADRLDWFQSSAAGIEHPVLQMLQGKANAYTTSHEQAEAIAEWVLWAGLDWFQGGQKRRDAQARKDWRRIEFTEIADTNWLIVGFGAIGQATGRRLKALGAHVTGIRRTKGPHSDADKMSTPDQIESLLPEADAVLLCCPHTEETEGMANASFFAAMKPGALFANVGRGLLVDEAALLEALTLGTPGHAALDVVAVEPLPQESPIWSHSGITLTAHLAADTMGSARRTDRFFLSNLDRFLVGEPLRNLVSSS